MKIGFIFPIADRAYFRHRPIRVQSSIYLGISYISSVLKLKGHQTRLFVLTQQNQSQVETMLDKFEPQLLCFTAVSTTYHLINNFADSYKKRCPHVFLLAGGCHVSLNPEEVIADPFDATCIGEGEYPALELADQLEHGLRPSNIQNLWIKNGADVEKNAARPFIENLDELSFPDRNMWKEWVRYYSTPPSILISRGCPFNCTYCCHHKLAGLAGGRYYRFRSPQNILQEIEEYVTEYPRTKEIYLETETIFINSEYVKQLCSTLQKFNSEREQPLIFGANLRITPHTEYETLFQSLRQANFKQINIGLESGSEKVRSRVLKRNYSNDNINSAVVCARKYGIKTTLYVMIGLPGETAADSQQTIEMCRRCKPDATIHNIFYPYPGTELAYLCEEEGLFDRRIDIKRIDERKKPVLNLPDFSQREVHRSYIWFEYNVFKGRKPVYKILLRVLQNKVFTVPVLEKLFNSLLEIRVLFYLKSKLINY
ncbi:MAG: radical SAM protein [Deltaproteobacteria bacterium]|nr:radical SAM protein [Deltaproteobacteria bacterium]